MRRQEVFIDIYEQITGVRLLVILFLLAIGGGTLYYINDLVEKLETREKKYATLYAESIKFFIEQSIESTCNYTFIQEMISANETVPMIVVMQGKPTDNAMNIPELADTTKVWKKKEKEDFQYAKIAEMNEEHPPIEFQVGKEKGYVYYSNSLLIKQLRFFPYILLGAFFILGTLAFIAYSSSRKAEQNRVWVGLAKETAHQLGTPISALMGWVELFKTDPDFDQNISAEIEKDIKRLEMITTRFSSIGSIPTMKDEVVADILRQSIDYLKVRISTKVKMTLDVQEFERKSIKLNRPLFEWVIENLCKNAVDSMGGIGEIHVKMSRIDKNRVAIDVTDTGKGITKANLRKIFKAGFSTKKRGWGLGLTLAKRIIENYHNGKLFVNETTLGKGTTFRIILKD